MNPVLAANRRGILGMAGAMACFVANDTVVKLVGGALFQAVRDLLTRRIRGEVPVVLITLTTTVVVAAVAPVSPISPHAAAAFV